MAVSDYNPIIDAAAQEWDVDPHWVRSVMQGESGGQRLKNGKPITSSAGAGGLMQIMPKTARDLGVDDVHDPVQAIWGGTKYLAQLRDQFKGNVPLATAAYNAGPDRVGQYVANGTPLPNETRNYLREVSGHYQKFAGQASAPSQADGQKPAPAASAAKPSDHISDDDFLKEHGANAIGAISDDDFLKEHGAAGAKAAPASKPPVVAPTVTPNDESGEGRDEQGNPLRPLAPGAPQTGPSIPEAMVNSGIEGAKAGWQNTPDILSPKASQWLSSHGLGVIGDNTGLPSYLLKGAAAGGNALMSAATTGIMGAANAIGDHPSVPFGLGNIPLLGRDVAALAQNPLAASPLGTIPPNGNPMRVSATEARLNARIADVIRDNPLIAKTADGAAPGSALSVVTPPLPPATAAAVVAPRTSAAAKQIASAYYKQAEEAGGNLTPEFTNRFIDKVRSVAPQTAEGQAIAGESEITRLADRIESLRDQPISLKGAQEIDEGIGGLIDKEFGPKGLTKEGKHLLDLQAHFRDMIQSAGPQDISGGSVGFDALQPARKAWAQAMKMADLERIAARAELTDNPATSIKSGIRVLLSNPTRVRGYSPAEISALKQAADRGALGSALHVFGSRLVPLAAGTAALGASGFVPAMAVAGATHLGSSVLRNAASALQAKRMNNALSVLGSSVPPAP